MTGPDQSDSLAQPPVDPGAAKAQRRRRLYWGTTVFLATECLVGGVMGTFQLPPFIEVATRLGYPSYFMTILGVWYVLAGLALLAPGRPRLKEWAYAGLIFNYTGAAASHAAAGDGLVMLIPPVLFASLTVTSWTLCTSERRTI